MDRNIQDALIKVTTALPAQNTNNNTASIDLGQTTAGSVNERIDLLLTVPATPALANGQTQTFQFQDSADNVTFAAIPQLASAVITGAGGVGGPALSWRLKLPGSARRYIRANQAASATAADNTAISSILQLTF